MAEIKIEGLEEFQEMIEKMTLDEADEKKAMRAAIKVTADEVENNTPVGKTKRLSKIKKTVKKEDLGVVGTVKMGAFYDIFQEFGTSKSKKNVGFFERGVNKSSDEAVNILAKELLGKAK